ncbi:hypothetical protein CKM354_000011200 [Cercospora kikuchii]|uniref:Uncharacterized protein n=1 Tax=Cercospora kikuchii TaxID=84275 RepID=A0A9P3CD96_9PEZI|nr:uncharacterized protein CKM354_000011200 [Cercospora kikuchii]GIZ36643.1 hypothetical protein CKM354_000011200 [Cercospora kikuchii]
MYKKNRGLRVTALDITINFDKMKQSRQLLLSLAPAFLFTQHIRAAPSLDDTFRVATGNIKGTCDKYRRVGGNGLLDDMFEEMQQFSSKAVEELKQEPKSSSDEVQKLLRAFFAVNLNDNGDDEGRKDLDLAKVNQIQKWFKDVDDEINQNIVPDERNFLYCDSTFMEYHAMTHKPALDGDGKPKLRNDQQITIQEYLSPAPTKKGQKPKLIDPNQSWPFYLSPLPGLGGYLELQKSAYKTLFPNDPQGGGPTYCAQKDYLGWTLHDGVEYRQGTAPKTGYAWGGSIVVLCPALFESKAALDKVDLTEQKVGTQLDTLSTKALTWYHEMFHIAFPDMMVGNARVEQAPDARRRVAMKERRKENGVTVQKPSPSWPQEKKGWVERATNTDGGIDCMYLGLWDAAAPLEPLENQASVKNPESYAWFGLALYLTTEGPAHQDWSTGAAREKAAPPERVTVTIPGKVPRHAATALPAMTLQGAGISSKFYA